MSVSSSKIAVTCENPNFESERTSTRPGRPEMACSATKVICRSTSTGESSGAVVLTCTWTGVVSGNASKGSSERLLAPAIASTAVAIKTTGR